MGARASAGCGFWATALGVARLVTGGLGKEDLVDRKFERAGLLGFKLQ